MASFQMHGLIRESVVEAVLNGNGLLNVRPLRMRIQARLFTLQWQHHALHIHTADAI